MLQAEYKQQVTCLFVCAELFYLCQKDICLFDHLPSPLPVLHVCVLANDPWNASWTHTNIRFALIFDKKHIEWINIYRNFVYYLPLFCHEAVRFHSANRNNLCFDLWVYVSICRCSFQSSFIYNLYLTSVYVYQFVYVMNPCCVFIYILAKFVPCQS